jgi:SpoVK/Ycf46/Vps4 family AAA+-type ATPase
MSNKTFLTSWTEEMSIEAPCIALFEDNDTIFEGRKNVTGMENGLTFDCFLNALGGVDIPDGVLVVITTNRPEVLDPAIASVPSRQPVGSYLARNVSRPGRIEDVVELGPPDTEGRYKIAHRILAGYQEVIDRVVASGSNDSGAQFLDRCRKIALDAYWKKPTLSIEEAA